MSAEFYLEFSDPPLGAALAHDLRRKIMSLPTFVDASPNGEIWLRGVECRQNGWAYDVRLFTDAMPRIMVEISAHPPSIEADLNEFFGWLRGKATVRVVDDDGETSDW